MTNNPYPWTPAQIKSYNAAINQAIAVLREAINNSGPGSIAMECELLNEIARLATRKMC